MPYPISRVDRYSFLGSHVAFSRAHPLEGTLQPQLGGTRASCGIRRRGERLQVWPIEPKVQG